MQKITPYLWFDDQAEEAAQFYTSIFKDSRITEVSHYVDDGQKPRGSVKTVSFQLEGQEFVALNGGPHFTFTPAISFFVNCKTQEEVDTLWEKLGAGGKEEQCGWLRDKFGVSWQIIPSGLVEMLNSSEVEKAQRATNAMLEMVKIDLAKIKQAYDGD